MRYGWWLVVVGVVALGPWPAAAEWDTFHGDNERTGLTEVNFPSSDFQLLWKFTLGQHTWRYCQGASVWAASPVFGKVKGLSLIHISEPTRPY